MRTGRWLVLLLAMFTASCSTLRMPAARSAVVRPDASFVLEVPYVSQSELLCGGAAIAMIERWWGRRGVYAEEFQYLVKPAAGGILTTDMVSVMRSRGWDAQAQRSTAAVVQQSVADSVPVITLIKVSANRYHYVVILGWTATEVTYHDPAVAPAVRVRVTEFLRRWNGANAWAMIVRPAAVVAADGTSPPTAGASIQPSTSLSTPLSTPSIDSLPCRPWLDQAADAAATNRLDQAEQLLAGATRACPSEPLVLRELAGVRFRQGRRPEAIVLANAYSRRAPADTLGWQLLASSRYLVGDETGALQAWNTIGRPTIDLLRIDGSRHIRFRALADGIDLRPGAVLTPSRFKFAQRRLSDIPALATARVKYAAVAGGVVEVRGVVTERPLTEPLGPVLVISAIRAAVRQSVTLSASTPLGRGELWSVQWRWQPAEPRVALRVAIPTRIGIPTIVRFERSWDMYRFSGDIAQEQRSSASASLGGWLRPNYEHLIGVRFERWTDAVNYAAISTSGAWHAANDHVLLLGEVEHAFPMRTAKAYDRLTSRLVWTMPPDRWSNDWSIRLGTDVTSANTPLGLSPIAGGNFSRDIPLRAHPIIIDNRLPSVRIGRAIVHGGIAADRALATIGRVALGAGLFVDGAQVRSVVSGAERNPLYLDAGAGLLVGLAGAKWTSLRFDVARGLVADKRWGVSVGIAQARVLRVGRTRP